MRVLAIATVLALSTLAAPHASAQPAEVGRPGRYTMQPVEGGFLRLDSQTGEVSLCTGRGAAFACEAVADKRAEPSELAQLRAENLRLQGEMARLTDQLAASPPAQRSTPRLELPTEEDVDKALTYLERMVKKFRDRLREFDSPTPPRNTPM